MTLYADFEKDRDEIDNMEFGSWEWYYKLKDIASKIRYATNDRNCLT